MLLRITKHLLFDFGFWFVVALVSREIGDFTARVWVLGVSWLHDHHATLAMFGGQEVGNAIPNFREFIFITLQLPLLLA